MRVCVCVCVCACVYYLVNNVNGALIVTLSTNIVHGCHLLGAGASNRLNFDASCLSLLFGLRVQNININYGYCAIDI